MWISKQTGLNWDEAQQALKDGLHVGHAIWHTTSEGLERVRIVLDKEWNLITKPQAKTGAIVLPPDSPIPPPTIVGKWKPTQPEFDSKEWIAFEWQD